MKILIHRWEKESAIATFKQKEDRISNFEKCNSFEIKDKPLV